MSKHDDLHADHQHDTAAINADDDGIVQHVTITLDLPGGWGTSTTPLAALMDILDRLERDGIRPQRTTLEITDTTTA
jgi:hypothetical protein